MSALSKLTENVIASPTFLSTTLFFNNPFLSVLPSGSLHPPGSAGSLPLLLSKAHPPSCAVISSQPSAPPITLWQLAAPPVPPACSTRPSHMYKAFSNLSTPFFLTKLYSWCCSSIFHCQIFQSLNPVFTHSSLSFVLRKKWLPLPFPKSLILKSQNYCQIQQSF